MNRWTSLRINGERDYKNRKDLKNDDVEPLAHIEHTHTLKLKCQWAGLRTSRRDRWDSPSLPACHIPCRALAESGRILTLPGVPERPPRKGGSRPLMGDRVGGKREEEENRRWDAEWAWSGRNGDGKESPCHGGTEDTTKQRIRYRKKIKRTHCYLVRFLGF